MNSIDSYWFRQESLRDAIYMMLPKEIQAKFSPLTVEQWRLTFEDDGGVMLVVEK